MGNLRDDLPEIVKKALKEEDKVTKGLVKTLLQQVMINQNKGDSYPIIKRILDDEMDKLITVGFIDINDFQGAK